MNTREAASAYRLSQWSQALQERASSGESIKDFCERRGISRNTYFYWQRKLRGAAMEKLAPAAGSKASQALVPSGWAVCEATKPVPEESNVTVTIGKFRVFIGSEASPEQLEKTLRVLMKLC